MKEILTFLLLLMILCPTAIAQKGTVDDNNSFVPDFIWGNGYFFQLKVGESIYFNQTKIQLIAIDRRINRLVIGSDTVSVKASGRTFPLSVNDIRIYVASNKTLKGISENQAVNSLLKKDALIGVTLRNKPFLDFDSFCFPVGFNKGYIWSGEEISSQFATPWNEEWTGSKKLEMYGGIDFDMTEPVTIEGHPIVAFEKSSVRWIEKGNKKEDKNASVLLQSSSNGKFYYYYQHLNSKSLKIKKGSEIEAGDELGVNNNEGQWPHLHFAVLYSDTLPSPNKVNTGILNVFPQVYELYYNQLYSVNRTYTSGRILFGKAAPANRNCKNVDSFDDWCGKGWILGAWNIPDKVEWVTHGDFGNARLRKTLFAGTKAVSYCPFDYFEYQIACPKGTYRIRAEVGDALETAWQKVEFEGVTAGVYRLAPGEFRWTTERVVKVIDNRMTIRIYLDTKNNLPAGISEIIFQQVN